MKNTIKALTFVATLLFVQLVSAQQYSKITYVHTDPDGTPFAATDSRGNAEWQIDHFPYGKEYENTEVARKSDVSFAGKPYDEEIGLSYFGARWYDPDIGRFTGIDPMPVNPEDYRTYNRYAYGFNNPYKYVDPDGNFAFLIPIAIFVAKEIAAEVASRATGGATDFLSVRRLGSKLFTKSAQIIGNKGKSKLASGASDDVVRVRHFTTKDGLRGIKNDGAIVSSGRGAGFDTTRGVHVEVAPFGKAKGAGAELGVSIPSKTKHFVEFDMRKSAIKPTGIGSKRNTAVIPTSKPLKITNKRPRFK